VLDRTLLGFRSCALEDAAVADDLNGDIDLSRKSIVSRMAALPGWLGIAAAILVAAAGFFAAVPKFEDAVKPLIIGANDRYKVVRTPDHFLSLRVLPTKQSDEIVKMPEGAIIKCGDASKDAPAWRTCRYGQHQGYASMYYLEEVRR
jgi:hypothetical protein